jgi:hypothetical protein
MGGNDPLDDIYADEEPYDKGRLVDVVGQFVQVDKESGDPIRQPAFHDADLEGQVVALLLYRRIAVELGELDDQQIAAIPEHLADYSDADDRTVSNVLSDHAFIEEFDPGTYYIPEHTVERVIEKLELSL